MLTADVNGSLKSPNQTILYSAICQLQISHPKMPDKLHISRSIKESTPIGMPDLQVPENRQLIGSISLSPWLPPAVASTTKFERHLFDHDFPPASVVN